MVTNTFTFPRSNFIGFDHLWDEISALTGTNEIGFPKHNVVKHNETEYGIELALAGYSENHIDVEVKDGLLVISGDNTEDNEREFIHKGISGRKFKRTFRLSEHVVVDGASFINGLLCIELRVEIPEERRPRRIEIK